MRQSATALMITAVLWVAGCATGPSFRPAHTTVPDDPIQLPSRMWGGYFIVRGHLNGAGPYTFLLDTGSDCMLVGPNLAADHADLVEERDSSIRGWNGDIARVDRALRIRSLTLGSATFRDFDALVMDVDRISEALGLRLDGVVGLPLFQSCLLTLDYPSRRVWVQPGRLAAPNGRDILELREGASGEVVASLGERRVVVKIDSGYSRELGLPENIPHTEFAYGPRPGAEIVTITGTTRPLEGYLNQDLVLGEHRVHHPHAALNGGDAKLGNRILRNFMITFDQKHGRIQFARPGGRPLLANRRRIRWVRQLGSEWK